MMKTYEEKLIAEGRVTTGLFNCPECDGPPQPAFAICERSPGRWTCSSCYIADVAAEETAAAIAEQAQLAPWEQEEGLWIKAQRTQLQTAWRWTVMPDSPLNEQAKNRCMSYLQTLNRLTIDFQSPADVVWPDLPTIEANDYASS